MQQHSHIFKSRLIKYTV